MKLRIISKYDLAHPHHVVLVGDNGEPLMHSENYSDLRDAEHLVELLTTNGLRIETFSENGE